MVNPPRILLAKIGLDGHDRGVKVLARSFRDAGFEVIYTGLWQTAEATMHAALQEDVDVVGVSLLSAAHMTVMPEVLRLGRELGVGHIPVVLGGIVPEADYPRLREMGVAAVFNPGSPIDKILDTMRELATKHPVPDANGIRDAYASRDVRALAKLITLIAREAPGRDWPASRGKGKVIGITGAPGVGKSSFIGKLGRLLRERSKRVAVLAIDPSSPITGGALLGDRLRMMAGPPDPDMFIRSVSSRGLAGGLAPHAREVVDAISGFGFDIVLVETVGAGQADVAVREICNQTLLVLMPDSGDAMQFLKAGIIEIAQGFVLNKCDLAGVDATEAQLRGALDDERPIWKVSAVRNEGIDAVADWITRSP